MNKAMRRNTVIAAIALAIMACAMYAGWSHYQATPQGDLLYTPKGPCPSLAHSFTTGYLLTLGLAAILCMLIAALMAATSCVPRLAAFKPMLRSLATACLVIAALLLAGSALHLVMQSYLPLQVEPSCTR